MNDFTSQNSSSRLTPKLNVNLVKEPGKVLPSVELLLAEKNSFYKYDDLDKVESQMDIEPKSPINVIKWPAKLEINFEQGLSPKSGKSSLIKVPHRTIYQKEWRKSIKNSKKSLFLIKILDKKPLKSPNPHPNEMPTFMSRRLSSNISPSHKPRAKSFFNSDLSASICPQSTIFKHRKPSSRIDLQKAIDGHTGNEYALEGNMEKKSPTKNMCIDTQDFEEVVDSSCFDSYQHILYSKEDK